MPHWELLPEESVSKSLARKTTYPTGADAYGEVFFYDLSAPRRIVTLKGHGLTDSDLAPYLTAINARNGTLTVTDSHGRSHTGVPVSLTWPTLEGLKEDSEPYNDVTLQLEKTT